MLDDSVLVQKIKRLEIEHAYYEHTQKELVHLMQDFQTGGKYAYMLKAGDNIIIEGIKILLKFYELHKH